MKKYVILPFLIGDCFLNMLARGSFHETLSARAHRLRVQKHKYWGWTADAIDAVFRLFGVEDHCRKQWDVEQKFGSVWKAWAAA